MSREHYVITRALGGWIVTKNQDLFGAALSSQTEHPIWVFTAQKPMMRFLSSQGFRAIDSFSAKSATAIKLPAA